MKICTKCNGCGKIAKTIKVVEDDDMFSVENEQYLVVDRDKTLHFAIKVSCPSCDGTGLRISQGEIGSGDLNDFGQEGEDITNL